LSKRRSNGNAWRVPFAAVSHVPGFFTIGTLDSTRQHKIRGFRKFLKLPDFQNFPSFCIEKLFLLIHFEPLVTLK
jgi:hypothetical protein